MQDWMGYLLQVLLALFLVGLNGFFVAAEFALVKVRGSRVDRLVTDRKPFAVSAKFLSDHMESALSACQLGITMASLGLGWVGEPAFAQLLHPLFELANIEDPTVIHTVSFIFAFTLITSLHLVVGEQAPKIYAIREPERVLLWCALPMRFFFMLSYPFMAALNWVTSVLLARLGLREDSSHDSPLTEDELRVVITEAHLRGHVSRSEHSLINAVFEFDDMVCRRIMVARNDVEFLDINAPVEKSIEMARRTKHTRYPICDGNMDNVLGVIHIKDLVGLQFDVDFDWSKLMRPPKKVPENMPISKLMRHFQATHQLLAFVIDEFGNTIGIVTLENVLETIIGDVDDEFDEAQKDVVPVGSGEFEIAGTASIEDVSESLGIELADVEADTFSGYLMHQAERLLSDGDKIRLPGATAEVIESRDDRALKIRVVLDRKKQSSEGKPITKSKPKSKKQKN